MVFAILFFSFYSTSTITSSISTTHSTRLFERSMNANETVADYIIPSKSFFEYHAEYIGRIFAWACTILYLTSRMPQIWKNNRDYLELNKENVDSVEYSRLPLSDGGFISIDGNDEI
ncbi:12899_t:CDS:2 [Dentiscutata erythropus]|uniref:12899_t:CDS:1 n=1 Tax=Dentiscutata erythropus TaxID=1348616 RepID=A0A9N9IUL7_9GLOM|nr:12899_t:CDS:2 [Dentiscutata erythropus]